MLSPKKNYTPRFMDKPRKRWMQSHEARLAVIVLVVATIFSMLSPGFRTLGNLRDMLESQAVVAIMAAGLLVVLIAGGIDVSIAAIAAVSQYAVAIAINHGAGNWFAAFAVAIAVGAMCGALNALLIHRLESPPVIVTIAMMTVYFSILMTTTHGTPIYDLPDWFTTKFTVARLPFPLVVAALILSGTAFLLARMSLGRQIFGFGGNPEAARRMGCRVGYLQGLVYAFSGATAGVAGLLQAYRVEEVVPNALIGRELDVLAAVVLGGASLSGGVGSVVGILLGILLLATLRNGLTLFGVSSYWFDAVTGFVILVSVSANAWMNRRQRRGVYGAG